MPASSLEPPDTGSLWEQLFEQEQQTVPPAMPTRPPPVLQAAITEPPETGDWFVIWQYEVEKGVWIDYEPDFCHELERHFLANTAEPMEKRPRGNVKFLYHTTEKWQMNTRSSRKRLMRRILQEKTAWRNMDPQHSELEEFNAQQHDPRRGMAPTAARSRSGSRPRSER
jgi:hypothetical protein